MCRRHKICSGEVGRGRGGIVFLGEERGEGRARAGVWAGRRQKAGSKARPEPRNGARPCLRRRPECKHMASMWAFPPGQALFISK